MILDVVEVAVGKQGGDVIRRFSSHRLLEMAGTNHRAFAERLMRECAGRVIPKEPPGNIVERNATIVSRRRELILDGVPTLEAEKAVAAEFELSVRQVRRIAIAALRML